MVRNGVITESTATFATDDAKPFEFSQWLQAQLHGRKLQDINDWSELLKNGEAATEDHELTAVAKWLDKMLPAASNNKP